MRMRSSHSWAEKEERQLTKYFSISPPPGRWRSWGRHGVAGPPHRGVSDRGLVPSSWFRGAGPVRGAALWPRSHRCCRHRAVSTGAGACGWEGVPGYGQGSTRHGELAAPKLQLCTAGTCSPALLCPLPRPCVGPFLLGGLRQASRPLPVRGQPCRSRRSLPGTAVLGAESSTRGAGGRSGRRCGR